MMKFTQYEVDPSLDLVMVVWFVPRNGHQGSTWRWRTMER